MKPKSVRTLTTSLLASLGLLAAGAALPGRAHAVFVFTLQETGGNVVLNGTGTINTAGLTLSNSGSTTNALIRPVFGLLYAGPINSPSLVVYSGITGPTSFGTGTTTFANSGSGDFVALIGGLSQLALSTGYVSNTLLTDSATFNGATFASLGFTPGTYTYTFGSGVTADLLVVTSVVPEPGTYALALLGSAGLLGAVRRRRPATGRA